VALPLPDLRLTAFTQWGVPSASANALGLVLSDARRLEVR
jgi:hypothetical protein